VVDSFSNMQDGLESRLLRSNGLESTRESGFCHAPNHTQRYPQPLSLNLHMHINFTHSSFQSYLVDNVVEALQIKLVNYNYN